MIAWKKTAKHSTVLVVAILGLCLITYTSYRAATLSITHDEAIIYGFTTKYSALDIYNYVIAQDHMLNTLLIKWSRDVFPDSDLTIRLPNLIGHLLYIIFTIALVWRWKDKHLRIAGFIILNFNPYLLDFFSIARGYGLSVSLMMVSIYFGYGYGVSKKLYRLALSLLFAILSVLTVYTLLNYFFALIGVVLLLLVFDWLTGYYKFNARALARSALTIILLLLAAWFLYLKLDDPISRVQNKEFIYVDAGRNLIEGTIRPVVFRSIYNVDPGLIVGVISYTIIGLYALAFFWMIGYSLKKNFSFINRLIFFSFFLISIVALSIQLQHELFNIRFLSNRTATFLIPLICLLLLGTLQELRQFKNLRIPAVVLSYLLAGLFIFNTALSANFSYYLEWKYDADTKQMLMDLQSEVGPDPSEPVKLGIVWIHEPVINYYRKNCNLDWLQKVDQKGYAGDFDYYYLFDVDSVRSKLDFTKTTLVKEYPVSKNILLKH